MMLYSNGLSNKFFNSANYPEQAKTGSQLRNNVIQEDIDTSVPNGFVNLIDRTECYTETNFKFLLNYLTVYFEISATNDPLPHSSTSHEAYDRRQTLRSIYSKKHSAATPNIKDRSTVKPSFFPSLPLKLLEKRRPLRGTTFLKEFISLLVYNQGRTPEQEKIDDLQEELQGIKRNHAAVMKENVVLKTRLKRLGNEIVRKDRQLQNLLFMQSIVFTRDQEKNVVEMKQKIVVLESLLKEKDNEISKLKADNEEIKLPEYHEKTSTLKSEYNRPKRYLSHITTPSLSKLRSDIRGSPRRQSTMSESYTVKKYKKTIDLLEKENDRIRTKLQIFCNISSASRNGNELATMKRDELIALVIYLKSQLKKKEIRENNRNTRNGQSRKMDLPILNDQRLVSMKNEQEKVTAKLKSKKRINEHLPKHEMTVNQNSANISHTCTKSKNDSEQIKSTTIMKIHSADELNEQNKDEVDMNALSEIIVPSLGKFEANDVIENLKSASNEIDMAVEMEKILDSSSEELENHQFEEAENAKKIEDEEERKIEMRKDRAARIIQRNWKLYLQNMNGTTSEWQVKKSESKDYLIEERSLAEEHITDASGPASSDEKKSGCSNTQECFQEEKAFIELQKPLSQTASIETTELQEEVMSNFLFQTILKTTLAHLKRLELLSDKANYCSWLF
ncbi:unnamed protein product [Thelazia callipaeda]|uniref:Lebercilin domain-containing protein n=1 Tax=Thelazia callipaeda TaxID=103827 RepID=A0A0N5CZR9_THECL|nr:unnamed protein product [Thelazia callipaeda]